MLYHPLKAWEHTTKKTANGKAVIGWMTEPAPSERGVWKRIELPCGQCIGCRLDYSRNWATRCILESKQWQHNQFVTLTYSPETVPTNITVDTETGEVEELLTLNKPDLQKFMKDLRRYYDYHFKHQNIRFYRCGEYGDKYKRPHYHLIIFNLPVPDLKYYFTNKEFQPVYTSEILSKIWGKGIVTIGAVTYQSAAYVARYILKKQTGEQEYLYEGREPEFTEMSRRPGIAADWYKNHKDQIYKNDEVIIISRMNKAISKKPPKYFDKLYDQIEPEKLSDVKKARRERAIMNRERKQFNTTLSPDAQLRVQERNQIAKANTLKRVLREDL